MGLYLTLATVALGMLAWLLYRLEVVVRGLTAHPHNKTALESTTEIVRADTESLEVSASEPEPWHLELQAFALRPLGDLPFECFAEPNALSGQIESSLIEDRAVSWTGRIGDSTTGILQIAAQSNGSMLVKFNEQAYELMRQADGTVKAVSMHGGKIAEIAHKDVLGTILSSTAQITALAVTVSHLISGADISRRLRKVEAKLDKLIEFRRIDQYAATRTAYESLRELTNAVNPDPTSLFGVRQSLRNLRHQFMGEAHVESFRLPDIERDPKWWQILDKRQLSEDKRNFADSAEKIVAGLHKAAVCLQLEGIAAAYLPENDQSILYTEAAAGFREVELALGGASGELLGYGDWCDTVAALQASHGVS